MLSLKIKQSNVRGRADFCHAMKSQIKAQFLFLLLRLLLFQIFSKRFASVLQVLQMFFCKVRNKKRILQMFCKYSANVLQTLQMFCSDVGVQD